VSEQETDGAARGTGSTLIAASVASVGFMLRHPTVHATSFADALAELDRGAVGNGVVHGALIGTTALLLAGFAGLCDRLGGRRPTVRIGLVAAALGTFATAAAATINGFVVPALAGRYAGKPEQADLARGLLTLCHLGNQAAARVGAVALLLALLTWSIALVRRAGGARALALSGIVFSSLLAVVVAAGVLPLDVHGMLLIILGVAAWSVASGVLLLRGRL
jgi:hypothetical protein